MEEQSGLSELSVILWVSGCLLHSDSSCKSCCIPPEGYSEVDIVLDEDGGRNVAGKVIILRKNVDFLQVLHKWFLR